MYVSSVSSQDSPTPNTRPPCFQECQTALEACLPDPAHLEEAQQAQHVELQRQQARLNSIISAVHQEVSATCHHATRVMLHVYWNTWHVLLSYC